ncbi:hypothetical protein [Piscirickettsia litoralis]|uniref:hypothetical protein n=1 Tax=Piscirickettsia litoralis TaxID=1891921 RepID=UPI001914555B|nr:hypothetical protein [Piscirickettsia litoralis]
MFKDKAPRTGQDTINDLVFSIVREQKTEKALGEFFFKLLFVAYILFITAAFFIDKK